MPATMHFMKHIKKADRNYLFLLYSLSLWGGEEITRTYFILLFAAG